MPLQPLLPKNFSLLYVVWAEMMGGEHVEVRGQLAKVVLSTTWVLGTELWLSGFVASIYLLS